MSQGRNAMQEIEVKTECDGEKCPVCYYDNTNGIHNGNITSQLISCDFISFGDYDNSCAVERANVRYLKEQGLIEKLETGSYNYEKAWLLDTPENRELLNSLFDYPCFDDELVSEIENEIETEYIKNNDDIYRATKQPLKDILDFLDLRVIDAELYYKAKENLNMEFVVESGGNGYIDLDKMVSEYNLLLCDKYPFIKTLAELKEITAPVFPIDFYESASDMKQHKQAIFSEYSQDDINQLLNYTIELEINLSKVNEIIS